MSRAARGLLDTSVLIANETGRRLDLELVPDEGLICVVTLAELHTGVLAARDTETRARRLVTLGAVGSLQPLSIDSAAAEQWASLRVRLGESGRRVKVNDLWIAAVAAANGLPVVTQDEDFDFIEEVGGPAVIRV